MNNSMKMACTPAGTHLFRVFLALFLASPSAASAHAQCPSVIWRAIVLGLVIGGDNQTLDSECAKP